jgi:hypothetical protein
MWKWLGIVMLMTSSMLIAACAPKSQEDCGFVQNVYGERVSWKSDVRIEVWKYNPRILSINGYIDPLSLYLCYREDTNERVAAEINELIHNRKW